MNCLHSDFNYYAIRRDGTTKPILRPAFRSTTMISLHLISLYLTYLIIYKIRLNDYDEADDDNKPIWPSWAVGALFRERGNTYRDGLWAPSSRV